MSLNLSVATGITYQIFNDPHSVILNSKGLQYNLWYIHYQEISAGTWLIQNGDEKLPVYGDSYISLRFSPLSNERTIYAINTFFKNNESVNKSYIFLRYQNVVDHNVYSWYPRRGGDAKPLADYSGLFVSKNEIYDNGGSEVWT